MLNPRVSAELRVCIVDALQSGAGAANEAEQVARCFAAVRALVDGVCSEFGTAWNARPAIQQLPVELLCSVFQELDLAHRVRATHVCRAWRAAGLQDRALWSDILVGNRRGAAFSAMSPVLLRRSHPAPFRLIWPRWFDEYCSSLPSEEIWREYSNNLPRMTAFAGPLEYAGFIGLLDHAAPKLEEFSLIDHAGDDVVMHVPPQWGGAGTPRLRTMRVPGFFFAPDCAPFEALRSFTGSLRPGGDGAARLFELCPNLEDLVLEDITPSSLLPRVPLPRSLNSVTLDARSHKQDPTALLAQWMQDPPRCLTIRFEVDLQPVLRLFARAYRSGEWSMFVYGMLYLSSPAGHEYVTLLQHAGAVSNPFLGLSPQLDRLGSITLAPGSLADVCNARLALPRLRALRLFLYTPAEPAWWDNVSVQLQAPALAELDLVWLPHATLPGGKPAQPREMLDVFFGRVPRALRALVAYDAGLLARVRVVLPPEAAGADMSCSAALAGLACAFEVHFDRRLRTINLCSSQLSRVLDAL